MLCIPTLHYLQYATQPVNHDTGKLYGEALASKPMISVNESWFQQALISTGSGYSSLGTKWNKAQDSLFLNHAAMDGRGVISLGMPQNYVTDCYAALDFCGGDFHLAAADGRIIMGTKLQHIQIVVVQNSLVLVRSLSKRNGLVKGSIAYLSSVSNGGKLSPTHGKISRVKCIYFCSTLEVAGVLQYVLNIF